MNTAQCVIKGHKPKFSDTKGHNVKMLWACNLFVVSAGLILSSAIINMNKFNRVSGREFINTVSAMCFSIHFLSLLCTVYIAVCIGVCFYSLTISLLNVTLVFIMIWSNVEHLLYVPIHYLSFSVANRKVIKAVSLIGLYTYGGNTICYISCWLVIGIRINPSWGLTIALFIISIFATFTYAVYLYLEVFYPNGYSMREPGENTLLDFLLGTYTWSDNRQNDNDDQNRVIALFKFLALSERFRGIRAKFVCMLGCIAVGSIFVVVILAGPSIGGQSAADELLKTSALYFITAFITWATLKKHASIDTPLQNERTQNAEGQDTDHHTGDHPGGEFGTLVQNNYYYYHYYHGNRRVSYEHSYTFTRETRV